MLKIPKTIFQDMISHAVREAPLECCGILAGKGRMAVRGYEVPNAEGSAISYSMRPEDQLQIFREMEVESLDMVAIYHSHPHVSPFPSDRDMELAFYPDVAHIIISLQNGRTTVKGFRISKGEIAIEHIRVMG